MAQDFVEEILPKLPAEGSIDIDRIDAELEDFFPELVTDAARVAIGRRIPFERRGPDLQALIVRY